MPHRASQRDVGGDAFQWQNYGFELLLGVLCVGCACFFACSLISGGLIMVNGGLMVINSGLIVLAVCHFTMLGMIWGAIG